MADSKLMSAVGTCDGTNYQDHRANLVEYCVLEDIEHVLRTPCPDPITATLAAGVWGDDEHPCGDEDPRKGSTAPQRTNREPAPTHAVGKVPVPWGRECQRVTAGRWQARRQ